MKKTLFLLSIVIFMSGCMGTHSGYLSTHAVLNSANFSYVQQNIEGQASTSYVFGIGGMAKEKLIGEAKQDLPLLKSNQAYVNVTVNFKKSHWFPFGLIVNTVTCIITADIVEFNDNSK